MAGRERLFNKEAAIKKEGRVAHRQRTGYFRLPASPINQILYLQRTLGNQAVQRLFTAGTIQPRLRIGQPNDIYEQEADRVAEQVMRMPEPQVQRQTEEEEKEEEELIQTKPISEQITPLAQRQVEEEEEEEEELVQTKALSEQITPLVQRQEEEEQEEEEEELLMAKDISGRAQQITDDLHIRLNLSKGSGQPLQETDRNFMERRLGVDFSGVRVHTDSNAVQMSRELTAQAFTHGRDIYFGAGGYSPGTPSGKRLLAHELTHVVQQGQHKKGLIQRQAAGTITWNSPVLNRRNAAKVFYYSKALMGTPAGLTTLVVNGNDIKSNYDLMSAIPQPYIDSAVRSDGSIICWFKNSVNATANTRLDIFTKPPWKFTLPTSEVAKKYSSTSQCQGKTGKTVIRARDWYNKDAKLEKLVYTGEMEHNKADRGVFKKFVGKYVANINKHLGPKKGHVISGSKTAKSSDCKAKLRKIENRQLLTDMVIAMNKANARIHRNNRHEVSVFGININKNCSRVLIQVIPPNL